MVNNARWLTAALKRKLTELQDRYIQEWMAKILDETTDGDANYRLIKTHFAYSKYLTILPELSLCMRKPTICIGENKDADQLRGDREADQRLCFRYTDSTIPLLLKSKISSL